MFAHEQGWRRRRRGSISKSSDRAVRHAVVHLPAADLLRRHQADAQPAVAGRSGSFGAALEIAHVNTGWTVIDEFAAPLRLFLHRLYLGARTIFALTARRAAHAAASALAGLLALGRWSTARWCIAATPTLPFVSLALGLARRLRGGHGRRADGEERPVPAAALLRATIRSSSTSPSSCRWRRRRVAAAQDRHRHRPRHRSRLIVTVVGVIGALCLVLGGARTRRSRFLFERPACSVAPLKPARRRRCSRRNKSTARRWPH